MLARSLLPWCVATISVSVFGARAANAACVINGVRPTGSLPTMAAGQEFSFVATPDCETLFFRVPGTTFAKIPRVLPDTGGRLPAYKVVLSESEWDSLVDEGDTTFTWSIIGTTSTGVAARVTTTNELVDGPVTLTSADADVVVEAMPSPSSAQFASDIETADVDADGVSDLVVAAQLKDGCGAVYVAHGPVTASTTTAGMVVLSGTTTDADFGAAVDGGDENGDGVDDLLVGATGITDSAAYLFLGPVTANREDADADAVFEGGPYIRTGADVDVIPDFDGDGTPDVAIGAPHVSVPRDEGTRRGEVYIVSGPASGTIHLAANSDYTYQGRFFWDSLGYVTASAGDVNGDGIDDLAMGDADGYVYLVDGGGTPGTYIADAVASASVYVGPYGGTSLASVDYDADGSLDLLVGAPGADSYAGAVYGFLGPLSGSLQVRDAAVNWSGGWDWGLLGTDVATGDVDGDEEVDVLMGAQYAAGGLTSQDGAAFLQLGLASGAVDVATLLSVRGEPFEGLGSAIAMIPDWTGDDADEVAIATPYADGWRGAVYVFFSEGLAL